MSYYQCVECYHKGEQAIIALSEPIGLSAGAWPECEVLMKCEVTTRMFPLAVPTAHIKCDQEMHGNNIYIVPTAGVPGMQLLQPPL